MYILLSSAATPRYKQDILRCLAAPLGATVQFRYATKYVADGVLQQIQRNRAKPTPAATIGLVCFVDTRPQGSSALYPIRKVVIDSVVSHGSTISLTLRMQGFAFADTTAFTQAVAKATDNINPIRKIDNSVEGKFFFSIQDSGPQPQLSVEETIAQWERVVEQLQGTPDFAEELFFWTVVGIGEPSGSSPDDETIQLWEEKLQPQVYRSLLIYHYRPKSGDVPHAELAVDLGGPLESASPKLIEIDSRYDLKRWFFRTTPRDQHTHHGWIRIRSNDEWNLDLPAVLEGSWLSLALKALLAGTFIAAPAITAIVGRHSEEIGFSFGGEPHWGVWIQIIVSLLAGWVAAFLVLCFSGVPRIRS